MKKVLKIILYIGLSILAIFVLNISFGLSNAGEASQEDIYSAIAYLRTSAPIERTVLPSKANFPFNIIMKFIPTKGHPRDIPDRSDLLAYGNCGCIDSHTPQGKGQLMKELHYAGNFEFINQTELFALLTLHPIKKQELVTSLKKCFLIALRF